MNINVAVTGICSGLGKSLISKLQNDPLIGKIIGIDISDYAGAPEKIQFFKVDVRDREGLERALKTTDVLIHLAFIVNPKTIPKIKTIYDINVNGSKCVFQAAATNSVKKIIHLSSQSAYGHLKECPSIVTEEAPRLGIKTTNFYYAHTKALVEEYLDEFEKQYPAIIITRFRPPIISGPHFNQKRGIFSATDKKRIMLPSPRGADKVSPVQIIHEEDLTDLLLCAIKRDLPGAYNISGCTLQDLGQFMNQQYGVKIVYIPRFLMQFAVKLGRIWPKLRWALAVLYNSLLDTRKIEQNLGWTPKYTTEECIREINEG